MKLGSLFDGSGGFPLAARLAGIEPVWASEVEPYPIAVTRKHFPEMKHFGDVSRIDGGKVEPVDVITFGSPCQDLSTCGRQKGLDGERSGLFFQAVRIIKEMRGATNGKFPRYAIWENVLGSLSSNNGNDFARVLDELLAVVGVDPVVRPTDGWRKAGAILGDGFSLCWRVLDAQHWGVLQRRKRVFLVVDFRDESSTSVLFKQEKRTDASREIEEKKRNNSEDGRGYSEEIDFFGVSHISFKSYTKNVFPTLVKNDSNWPTVVFSKGLARHLTSNEYALLQGFPEDWGKIEAIDESEFPFWREVWNEYARIFEKKRRSDKQVRSWMASPYRESAEYAMWGNGVALPCVRYIVDNIAEILRKEN